MLLILLSLVKLMVVMAHPRTCCEAESKPAWEVLAQVEAEVKRLKLMSISHRRASVDIERWVDTLI